MDMCFHSSLLLSLLHVLWCTSTPILAPVSDAPFAISSLTEARDPIVFPVPNTNTVLKIILGPPVDPHTLTTLLAVSTSAISNAAALFGEDVVLPHRPLLELSDGYAFSIGRTHGGRLTWALAKDTVSGVRQFYIERKDWRCVAVQVWESWEGKRWRVGDAMIRREPEDDGDN